MKKALISIMLLLAVILGGCNSVANQNDLPAQSYYDSESNPDELTTSKPNSNDNTDTDKPLPSQSIEIQSLDKLNEMRGMLSCDDEMQLGQYIQSIADTGVHNKDDLFAFVNLIDSLPKIPVLNGNITWICFSHGVSEDTGEETNVVFITTVSANGNWTRIEYVLSVTDISKKISDEIALIGEDSMLNSPIKTPGGNLTLYVETRKPHPSGNGTVIQWIGEVEEMFTRIYYFTNTPGDVETETLFNNIQIYKTSK